MNVLMRHKIINFRHGVGGPVVGEIDGEYHYDHKRSILVWQLPVIDSSNKTGTMEFSIAAQPDDFFPVNVTFVSSKSYCDIKVSARSKSIFQVLHVC